MTLRNPLASEALDMQDIRGDQYAVMPPVRQLLRAEGLGYAVLACVVYHVLGFSWTQFALWFLLPDVAILVYVFASERVGMYAYNLTHSSIGAALVGGVGVAGQWPVLWQISLIWFAHIGVDRALGFGLKFPLGFRVTHLGVMRGMWKDGELV
jgi:hypothetical protein